MRDFLPAFALAGIVIGSILVWELTPPNTGSVIAVLGPGTSLRDAVTTTDAYIVREGPLPNSFILFSRTPDFPARLREAGAVVVLRSNYSGTCAQGPQIERTIEMRRFESNKKRRLHDEIS